MLSQREAAPLTNAPPRRERPIGLGVLAAVHAAAFVFLLPRVQAPFNDDWCYSWIAKTLYEKGRLVSTGLESTPQVVQPALGAAACVLGGGFSFLALHTVTLLFAFAGAVAFYSFLKGLGFGEARSTAGSLVLTFNPIYFLNSVTFMTDVPGFAFAAIALYLLARGTRERRDVLVVLGMVAVILGIFTRLFVAPIAVAYCAWVVVNPAERRRLTARRILLVFLVPILSGVVAMALWMSAHGAIYQPFGTSLREKAIAYAGALLTLGLFVVPVALPPLFFGTGARPAMRRGTFVAVALTVTALLVAKGRMFPFLTNQITVSGMFEPYEFLAGTPEPLLSDGLRLGLTALSVLASAAMISFVLGRFAEAARDGRAALRARSLPVALDAFAARWLSDERVLVHGFSLLYVASLLRTTRIFDRYLILLIPSAVVVALDLTRSVRFPVKAVAAALAGLLLFAVFLATDAIAWNRVLWSEARDLVKSGVSAREIDAGVAWCGWAFLDEPPLAPERLSGRAPMMWFHQFLPGTRDKYLFSFSRAEAGFRLVKEIPYWGLPFQEPRRLYLLTRTD